MPRYVKGESPAESSGTSAVRNKTYQLQVAEHWKNSLAAQQSILPTIAENRVSFEEPAGKGKQPVRPVHFNSAGSRAQTQLTATLNAPHHNLGFQAEITNRVQNISDPSRKQAVTAILRTDVIDKMQQRGVHLIPSLEIGAAPFPHHSQKPLSGTATPTPLSRNSNQDRQEHTNTSRKPNRKQVRFKAESKTENKKGILGYMKENPRKSSFYAIGGLTVAAAASIGLAQGVQETIQSIKDDNNISKDMARKLFIEQNPGQPVPEQYIVKEEKPEELNWDSPWTERLSAY